MVRLSPTNTKIPIGAPEGMYLKVISRLRKWGRPLSLGVFEQGLLSGASFIITALLARYLGIDEFGLFSIAWAIALLCEAILGGLFGDASASVFAHIEASNIAAARTSFLLLSCIAAFVCAVLITGLYIITQPSFSNLALCMCMATFIFCQRLMNATRRILYIDGQRGIAAFSAIMNVTCTTLAIWILVWANALSGSTALLALSTGYLLSGGVCIVKFKEFQIPTWLGFTSVGRKLWETGRWSAATASMSWLGNFGVIPFTGFVLGASAGGTLRAIQTFVVPITQVNLVLVSIIIPALARDVRIHTQPFQTKAFYRVLPVLSGFGILYSIIIFVEGSTLFYWIFGDVAKGATTMYIAVATIGFTLESIRYSCNVILLAVGRTYAITAGQAVSLCSALILVPLGLHFYGLFGVVCATAISNNVNTLFVLVYFFARLGADDNPRRGA